MKKYYLLSAAFLALFFIACEKDNPIEKEPEERIENALLILNQGSWEGNNSTVALYDLEKKSIDKDFFKTTNSRGLGDTGNDMIRYGEKIYVVVNASNTVEVISAKDGKSLKQINFKNDAGVAKQPRFAVGHGGKVYVTSFDNTVSRIDTTSLAIDGSVVVGRNPEGICAVGNKLYVANSGGLDYATGNYDSTVSVIDVATFKEVDKIEVGKNPFLVFPDSQGDIYVSVRAIWSGWDLIAPGALKRIKSGTDEVGTIEGIEAGEFTIVNDKAYIVIDDYTQSKVTVYDCLNEKVVAESFIADGTEMSTPFSVSVDPASGDVFLTETDYTTPGNVYSFGKDGKLKYKIEAAGISPYKVIKL